MKFKELAFDDHFMVGKTEWIKTKNWTDSPFNAFRLEDRAIHKANFSNESEVVRLKEFRVVCEWVKTHELTVYAEDLESAIDMVNEDDGTLIDTDTDGSYLDDSFEVNEEVTMTLNGEES